MEDIGRLYFPFWGVGGFSLHLSNKEVTMTLTIVKPQGKKNANGEEERMIFGVEGQKFTRAQRKSIEALEDARRLIRELQAKGIVIEPTPMNT